MDNRKKGSIRLRILVLTTFFAAIGVVSSVVAILSINNLSSLEQGAGAPIPVNSLYIIFIALIVVAVVFAVYVNYSMMTRMQQPLNALEKLAYHLARTGNLQMPEEMAAELNRVKKVSDEVGSTIKSFEILMKSLLEKVAILEAVAKGDLRNRVIPASDEDYLGIAVNAVVTNLSNIVRDVITATEQLTIGANELSIGAQTLSQSSAQQSATMDMLHVTASEIASEAAENAERAAEASGLTAKISTNATEGGRKMLDMTTAMSEINKASHAIGSVMKVIDEIAFQTNILALNAAVEAARAGVHGKGFAVVADEVRNLATKSGDAANDSNAMIADTISKSDMGTKIVDEAIAFFKTIEDGIAHINNLLDEIAKAAKSQSFAIEQINDSLNDMTNVVYHNSATSEQGAAASEQMSSQTISLKETVNKFMLEDEPIFGPQTFSPIDTEIPIPEQVSDIPIFAAPHYEIDSPVFNPTITPSEDGGLSPAELYAEALEREVQGSGPAPITTPSQIAAPPPTSSSFEHTPGLRGGFVDDDSKY